jgi:hypothetical protein
MPSWRPSCVASARAVRSGNRLLSPVPLARLGKGAHSVRSEATRRARPGPCRCRDEQSAAETARAVGRAAGNRLCAATAPVRARNSGSTPRRCRRSSRTPLTSFTTLPCTRYGRAMFTRALVRVPARCRSARCRARPAPGTRPRSGVPLDQGICRTGCPRPPSRADLGPGRPRGLLAKSQVRIRQPGVGAPRPGGGEADSAGARTRRARADERRARSSWVEPQGSLTGERCRTGERGWSARRSGRLGVCDLRRSR